MAGLIQRTTKKLECLAARNKVVYNVLALYYKRIVNKEIRLADINENDRILCVGGGPCPFSGILLHEHTKAHVTIIDNDECCVEVSKQLVRNWDMRIPLRFIMAMVATSVLKTTLLFTWRCR